MDWQIILILFLLAIFLPLMIAGISSAPWIPTKKKDLKRIVDMAELKSGDVVYDLGCGDGRVLVELAREKDVRCVGLEISWLQWLQAEFNILRARLGRKIKIKLKSYFLENLENANLIFIFLTPRVLEKLKMKLERELKKGARVIMYVWPMPGWDKFLIRKDKPEEKDINLYLYQIK